MYVIAPETFKAKRKIAFLPLVLLTVWLIISSMTPSSNFTLDHPVSLLFPYLILVAISFIFFFIISKITISVTNDGLLYERFFNTQKIKWDDLFESEVRLMSRKRVSYMIWFLKSINDTQVEIKTILFSKKDKQKLAEILVNRCPKCHVSDTVKRFADNDFPWYYF